LKNAGKDGRMESEKMLSQYLANRLGKLKPQIENPGGNIPRRLRIDLDCNNIAVAAAAAAARKGYTLLFTVGARLLKLMEIMQKNKVCHTSISLFYEYVISKNIVK
jgi:hypothetical protein